LLTWKQKKIDVTADNGIVTLLGDVNFFSVRKEAARIAYLTEGVERVKNDLTVHGMHFPNDKWYNPDTDKFSEK
jgi:osmotically-inducible protein OsmY